MDEIKPFYFGTSAHPLFGCYHAPKSRHTRTCSVVLCYPMGHESIRAHRAYRQLAVRLSTAGFHVLRFDYYGCGDSGGDCEQGEIRHWLNDISVAIDEIKGICGVVKVCLVGLRLGGALSMMVAASREDVEALVLWDPIVSGSAYLEEMKSVHRETCRYSNRRSESKPRPTDEIMGFPLTGVLCTELAQLELLAIQKKPANHILLIESRTGPCESGKWKGRRGRSHGRKVVLSWTKGGAVMGEGGAVSKASPLRHFAASPLRPFPPFRESETFSDGGRLLAHLERLNTHLTYQHLPSPEIWIADVNKVLMPNHTLQAVVSWMGKKQ